MRSPGFLLPLQEQLENLPFELLERVNRPGGLEIRDLISYLLKPRDFSVDCPEVVARQNIKNYKDISTELRQLGIESLKEGSTAYCIMAGD